MADVLKCNTCNIVVDELLAFIQNKIDVMDDETMCRICVSAFSAEVIVKSKDLLFESIPTEAKKIRRKKKADKGKQHKDIEDIISLYKSTNPELIPVFVARDLHLLPPITFDHLDVTAVLKKINALRGDLDEIKASCVTQEQFKDIKLKLDTLGSAENHQKALFSSPFANVNYLKRGAYLDSGPIAFSHCGLSSNQAELSLEEIKNGQETRRQGAPTDVGSDRLHERESAGESESELRYRDIQVTHQPAVVAAAAPPSSFVINAEIDATSRQCTRDALSCSHLCRKEITLLASSSPSHAKAVGIDFCDRMNENVDTVHSQITVRSPVSPVTVNVTSSMRKQNQDRESSLDWVNSKSPIKTPSKHHRSPRAKHKTMAEIAQEGEWKTVERRKARRSENWIDGKTGTASSAPDEKFRAADVKVPLFITNVHRDTSKEDIVQYIRKKTMEQVTLQQINSKDTRKQHNAYKIYVCKRKLSVFLDETLWPDGIIFRKFVPYKPAKAECEPTL